MLPKIIFVVSAQHSASYACCAVFFVLSNAFLRCCRKCHKRTDDVIEEELPESDTIPACSSLLAHINAVLFMRYMLCKLFCSAELCFPRCCRKCHKQIDDVVEEEPEELLQNHSQLADAEASTSKAQVALQQILFCTGKLFVDVASRQMQASSTSKPQIVLQTVLTYKFRTFV